MSAPIPGFFQVISRKNDTSNNPYRLVCVYNAQAALVRLIQERTSSPNSVRHLTRDGYAQLPGFFVSPTEYKDMVDSYKPLLCERY